MRGLDSESKAPYSPCKTCRGIVYEARGLSIWRFCRLCPLGKLTVILAGTVAGGTWDTAAQSQKGERRLSAAWKYCCRYLWGYVWAILLA